MLKDEVNIQVLKVDTRLKTFCNIFFEIKRFRAAKLAFGFESLVRVASHGPQIDQSHGEDRLTHIIITIILQTFSKSVYLSVCLSVSRSLSFSVLSVVDQYVCQSISL